MKTTIAKNLRALRAKENYTIEYVAHRLGLSARGYAKIENGQTKHMNMERLEQLAGLYKVSLSALVEEKVEALERRDKEMNARLDKLENMMAIMMKELIKIRGGLK
jgi:transcriptional regulator with XRE-family HTH domain